MVFSVENWAGRRAEMPKLLGTPPIKNPGCKPDSYNTHAAMEAVVVFPWVPATANT